ncbi:MAG TPA: flippase [Anaerolineaceae bacterium]|nr:flippase [Anaerolineaceae bacterium]
MRNFSWTILKNSAFGLAAQLLIKVLAFAFSILIVRRLGAETFGQYSIVLAFAASFSIFSDLGLAPYTVRQVARWKDDPDGLEKTGKLYANILILRIALSILTTLVVVGVALLSHRPTLLVGAIAFNSLSFLLYAVQGSGEAILGGVERLDLTAGTKVLYQLVFVLGGAAVLYLGIGYLGLIGVNLIGVAIMAIVTWRMVRSQGIGLGRWDARLWPGLLKASIPFGLIGLALGLSYKYDSLLLGIFRGDAETGYYNAAYNLVFSILVISNVINTAIYPTLSRKVVSEPHDLPRIVERALGYLLFFALPVAVGGSLLADKLVVFLYTASYAPTIPALQIIIWVVPFMFVTEFLGYVVVITDQESRVARAVLVSTGINVLLNSYFVPRFGYLAAAVMTVFTEIILVGQHAHTLWSLIKKLNWKRIFLKPSIGLISMACVVLFLKGTYHIMIVILSGISIYMLSLYLLGVIGREDLSLIHFQRNQSHHSSEIGSD